MTALGKYTVGISFIFVIIWNSPYKVKIGTFVPDRLLEWNMQLEATNLMLHTKYRLKGLSHQN